VCCVCVCVCVLQAKYVQAAAAPPATATNKMLTRQQVRPSLLGRDVSHTAYLIQAMFTEVATAMAAEVAVVFNRSVMRMSVCVGVTCGCYRLKRTR
jgi:hypothetical protein